MNPSINRRIFLSSVSTCASILALPNALRSPATTIAEQVGIIDTHTHFYDPTRPQGVPWPGKNDALLYKPYLPEKFRTVTQDLGVAGTVVVEASAWLEDNQWILDLAKENPIIVGFVGHVNPGQKDFAGDVRRFSKNPLFRGIRLGETALAQGLGQTNFESDLKSLADQNLSLDVLGGVNLLSSVSRAAKLAPKLRIIINHLPFEDWDNDPAKSRRALRDVADLPNVFAKVSGVARRHEGRPIENSDFYKPGLDALWDLFGVDRLIYGSNWPVSEKVAPYAIVEKIVADYFNTKGRDAAEKFFWKNSRSVYQWIARGDAAKLGR